MSNKIVTGFITDEAKLNLKSGDLFDRIINLKINCKDNKTNAKESFVIRSDYELIAPDSNTPVDGTIIPSLADKCIIRRCTYKPSIKVQCKIVSSNTGLGVEIYVSNFFMLTSDGKHLRSFNSQGYTVESVEVAMGYWAQFQRDDNYFSASNEKALDNYFNIEAINGADKITITGAITVTCEKLPPDYVLHIKGYVGDFYKAPRQITDIATPQKALQSPVATSDMSFESICFNNITRRYVNSHRTDKELKVDKNGQLSVSDAKNYGIRVFLSEEAKKLKIRALKDSSNNKTTTSLYFENGFTVTHTLVRIFKYIVGGELEYTFNNSGDILVYTCEEALKPEKLNKAFAIDGLYDTSVFTNKNIYNGKLPAVYNINIAPVSTIVCPFFTFLEPFQYVEFASRYALTNNTAYFASYNPTISRFLVINMSISFATVDDINEVQLTAVAKEGDDKEIKVEI